MQDFNVSGVVVMCQPEDISKLWGEMEQIANVQCHYKDESGKIIITIESENIENEIKTLKMIEGIKGVMSAQMIYSYHSSELESMRDDIQKADSIPQILKDDTLQAQDITYAGDVESSLEAILKK
ncbi:chaperone NapD [Helicobacter mesocricetorum]|uniref:chaperone NapD n=1 Tax=Helicobacter mesocricetorum TaxID=87012 RepID=UPI000CF01EF1|nr:chaperone NapD [Helicobacter mesocricetorum]